VVFASFLAFLPLLMAAISVLSTFLLVLGLTTVTGVSMIVEFLIGLIGLGVAIDYSLLVVTRWREERARGLDNVAAVEAAMTHAGRAVLFSGLTVAVGLLALIVLDNAVYGNFPLMLTLIAIGTFLLLARAFRSVLLAIKAVVFNLVSLAAAYGALTFIWQQGHGSQAIWGIPASGAITVWVPLIVFAFLFGLSMDYEVFIISRIREAYDATGSARDAVVEGIGRTGRLVTSAALILMLTFLSMSSGPETDIKILATGLGAGILVDAVIVRALMVPAMVALFGRWNWWMPAGLARVLRAAPSPVGPRRQAPATVLERAA
jgi:uncharacterized membrane protein YdfJ with MMPL/SSD domain